jgi:hypothetical protein
VYSPEMTHQVGGQNQRQEASGTPGTQEACGKRGHQRADAHPSHRLGGKTISRKTDWVNLYEHKWSNSPERRGTDLAERVQTGDTTAMERPHE